MDLTVIIPCKDHHRRLVKLLETIPQNVAVIVVENNSKHPVEQLNNYLESTFPNVKTYISHAKGPGGARNLGMEVLETEWFTFADADDLFLPNFSDALKLYDDEVEADLIAFPPMVTMAGRQDLNQKLMADLKQLMTAPHLQDYRAKWVVPWSRFYRKSIVVEHELIFQDLEISEDVSFAMQYNVYAKRILFSELVIYLNQVGKKSRYSDLSSSQIVMDTEVRRWQAKFVFEKYGIKLWRYPFYSKIRFALQQAKKSHHIKIFWQLLQILFQSTDREG
ncbi:MAG: glycosyltransferase family 2 protein [Streptococcaceae bacterium]|nr:glycosyltransferase family 2 protein [Streptococcaceae bacterium]